MLLRGHVITSSRGSRLYCDLLILLSIAKEISANQTGEGAAAAGSAFFFVRSARDGKRVEQSSGKEYVIFN